MGLPHLHLFDTTIISDVFITAAREISGTYRFNDLHLDCNSIRTYIRNQGIKKMVFDLDGLRYYGSEMIAGLILMCQECERVGGRVVLCNVASEVNESLSAVQFFKEYPVCGSVEDALAQF